MYFLHYSVTSSLLGPNILLNTLFSNNLSLCSSFSVSKQLSKPYKTMGNIIVLYILIFKFLDSKLEDKRFCTEWQQAFPDSTPIENWTQVYMNLFIRNSPYYHLLKYLLFHLKYPMYI
jgi:hypothetical protein